MSKGRTPDPSLGRQTLCSYVEEVLDGDRSLRRSTAAKYQSWATRYIIPALGDRSLASIRPRDVRRFLKGLEDRGVGVPTVEGVHSLLRRVLGQAYREDSSWRTRPLGSGLRSLSVGRSTFPTRSR